jgi:hypothetical protein
VSRNGCIRKGSLPTLRYYHSLREDCGKTEEDEDFSCFDPCETRKMVEDEDHIPLVGLKRRGGGENSVMLASPEWNCNTTIVTTVTILLVKLSSTTN